MITSKSNLIFAYILYLIGRTEYRVNEHTLRRALTRRFFMASITGRYTNSPESAMEFDLARFREIKDAAGFVTALMASSTSSVPPEGLPQTSASRHHNVIDETAENDSCGRIPKIVLRFCIRHDQRIRDQYRSA
jgi:hypothetical protein